MRSGARALAAWCTAPRRKQVRPSPCSTAPPWGLGPLSATSGRRSQRREAWYLWDWDRNAHLRLLWTSTLGALSTRQAWMCIGCLQPLIDPCEFLADLCPEAWGDVPVDGLKRSFG